jgi:hypothetical protein
MKIWYTHISDPGVEKMCDAEKTLRENEIRLLLTKGSCPSREEWDSQELARFERETPGSCPLVWNC